eukprot:g2774.t1
MNIPLASPGRLPNRVITQSPAVGFRTMLGGGCPVAITIARNAKPGISTPQQIPAGTGAVPSEARMVLKAPFQAGPSMQLGVPNRVPPPSVRRTFNTTHTAVVPTVHRSSSADRRCFVQQLPCAGVIGSRQVSGTSEGTEAPFALPARLLPLRRCGSNRRTKQQIQRQTAHGAKQVNGHLNPQAVAALSLHGAPVARPVAGTRPDVIAFNSAFRACAFADAAHVQRLLRLMRQNAAEPDVVTSNTLISSYSRQLAWEESLAGVVQGRGNYPVFSSIACNAALSSLGFESNWPTSLALLEDVQMKGKADVVSFGAAMTALARASQSRLSLKLLDSLDDDLTNEQIYSAAISSCEGESCWKSVDLLKQARHRQTTDSSGLNAAATALGEGHRWRFAALLLAPALGIETDGISVNVALEALAKAASWERSLVLSSAISGVDLELDELGRASLITACTWRSQWAAALRGITVSTEVTSVEAPVVTALLAALVAQRAGHAVGLELMRRLRGGALRQMSFGKKAGERERERFLCVSVRSHTSIYLSLMIFLRKRVSIYQYRFLNSFAVRGSQFLHRNDAGPR